MRRKRHRIHAESAEVDRDFAQRLRGVGVHNGFLPPGDGGGAGDILQGAGFVVGEHQAKRARIRN